MIINYGLVVLYKYNSITKNEDISMAENEIIDNYEVSNNMVLLYFEELEKLTKKAKNYYKQNCNTMSNNIMKDDIIASIKALNRGLKILY